MRIAVDTRHWDDPFVQKVFLTLIKEHSQHQFILLAAEVIGVSSPLPANASRVVITPKPTNLLTFKWWYDVKLTAALKKHRADVFIGINGLLSLRATIPQMMIVQDLSFLIDQAFYRGTGSSFRKKYTAGFVKKATAIVAVSDYVKQQLLEAYTPDEGKVAVIGGAASDEYQPINWQEREKVKDLYVGGCEYFVFSSEGTGRTNLLNLLKAFSIFKKWQKTNLKLMITGGDAAAFKKELKKLETYKYRNEVVLRLNPDEKERAAIVASAYALVHPSLYEAFATPVVEAMQCEVPVITSMNSSMQEIAAGAALYADALKPDEMAEQMKRIFKDEQLRSRLIEEGKKRAAEYSRDKSSKALWSAIEKAVSA